VTRRKSWKGAVKTAATSLGSRRGIMVSSTEFNPTVALVSLSVVVELVEGEEEEVEVEVEEGDRKATHGRTPNSVLARFAGSSHRCSTLKPGGSLASVMGRPISSKASLRATWKGVSVRVSDLPVLSQLFSSLSFLLLVLSKKSSCIEKRSTV
jgi:hypothetical protein